MDQQHDSGEKTAPVIPAFGALGAHDGAWVVQGWLRLPQTSL
jgi:hypothetical protein